MSERSEVMEQQAVRDATPGYRGVPAETASDDVPSGYKRTEIGIIPKEWEAQRISDLARIKRGASPRPIADPKWFDVKSSTGWLRISDVAREGKYVRKTDQNLSPLGISRSRLVEPGNVIMSMAATVGRPAINDKTVCIHDGFVFFEKPSVSAEFLYYVLLAIEGEWEERGQTGSQVNLNTGLIGSTPVPVPVSSREQRAIATALSDADALIESLDRLIAKKRAIKQAAMQQLLTGQTRLPGFTGEWGTKRLGAIANIKTGSRNNEDKVEDGAYPFYVRSANVESINTYSYDCEAVLVPGEGQIGNIFHYINGRFDVHQRVYAITQFGRSISGKYVYLYMSQNFGKWAMKNTVKATVDSLRLPTFHSFEMCLPPALDEQMAIARILTDTEAEIEVLERRRDKAHQIKQGMMQQLLTGRVRLVEPDPMIEQ